MISHYPLCLLWLSLSAFYYCAKCDDPKKSEEEIYSLLYHEGKKGQEFKAGTNKGHGGVLLIDLLSVVCSVCFLI